MKNYDMKIKLFTNSIKFNKMKFNKTLVNI